MIFEADDTLALIEAYLAELHLKRQAPVIPMLVTAPHQAPPSSTTSTTPSPAPRSVSLPKLKVPTFSGNCSAWREFWDSFDGAVHAQPFQT